MIIYIDLLLLLNLVIDLLLLIGVSFLLKRNAPFFKLFFASLFASFSTLLLFIINNNYLLIIYKLLTSILMVIIAFRYNNFKYFKDNLIWLYILSVILGGIMYLLNDGIALSNQGIIFKENGLKINLIVLLIISPIVIYKYIKLLKSYKLEYSNYYDTVIYYGENMIKGTGFLDTGNKLKDPYFQKPIILVNNDLIKIPVKTFLVPYYTVNNKDLLEVFKPKKIMVNHKKVNALVGLSDVNYNGIKIILNKEIL